MLIDTYNFSFTFSHILFTYTFSQIDIETKFQGSQSPPVRITCLNFHCTKIGEACINCEQNQALEHGLRQDAALTNQ